MLNENIPASVATELRTSGHDVLAVKEIMRGASDLEVVSRAIAEDRILVTQDKDFGELAFVHGLPPRSGVILFRSAGFNADVGVRWMVEVIESRLDWAGHFAVVSGDRIRLRPLNKD